jgi:methylglutaconyl-CoA hydratase
MATNPYVKFTKTQNVGYIEFYNPPHHALPLQMLNELSATITQAGEDDDVHVLVLKSGGDRTFCAGASLKDLAAISTIDEGKTFFMGFANVINALRNNPKIIIGSVQGKAVGGGVGLAAAVDVCLASEFASIKLSELSIGIGPFVIEPALKRKLGLSVVSQLTLNPQTFFSAKWAREKGLFAAIFESNNELNTQVSNLANQLASCNPKALAEFKKIQWEGTDHWEELLAKRAKISGELALSSFTKTELKKFIKS